MTSTYRFLRTHDGVTRFARVTVASERAKQWQISTDSVKTLFGDSLRRGLSMAAAEQDRRGGFCHRLVVEELVESAADSSPDCVECAAAIAAWRSLGHEETDVVLRCEDGRWHVSFVGSS